MCHEDSPQDSSEHEIESEIRKGRPFTPRDALARLAGPGAMRGVSPVSRQQQADIEIGSWLGNNLSDVAGALNAVLQRQLKGSRHLLENVDRPLTALFQHCERIAASDNLLVELVREADAEWGRLTDERPHFNLPEAAPHPDDPYTAQSVRAMLEEVLRKLSPD
jgi:hypothetical protein